MTITIPPAALRKIKEELYPHLATESDDLAFEIARAAALALLENWPGMEEHVNWPYGKLTHIILPLTTETDNDKA